MLHEETWGVLLVVQPDEFEVWYTTEDFPDTFYPTGRMVFSVDALAHALFVTGRAPHDQAAYGWTSVYEWLHRVALVPAYVRRAPTGRLTRSDLARSLDRSEKVALSYALGQAMTGVFSQQVVSVRFLMHVDRYAARHGIQFAPNTRRRADLFGETTAGGWVVAEAKGRSGSIDDELKETMRAQKRTIRSIGGTPPVLAYACGAHFPQYKGVPDHLKLYAVDPEEAELEAFDLPADRDRFILAYYEPFLAALEAGQEEPTRDAYELASFGPFQVSIGVLAAVAQRVRQARLGRMNRLYRDVTELLDTHLSATRPANRFTDGTAVMSKWQQALDQDDWSTERDEGFPDWWY
ncbi:hypothetical protein ACFY5C_27470 [Streptomyces sp. NPDC012935]|uniref:hypothetical protein n=1 Tax=Streptomyces sp. NPDC012935 TaxID=3364857 RepID=UPI0036865D65